MIEKMKYTFKNKFAVVSGASRGIGRAIAELLLELECQVLITGTGSAPTWCARIKNCRFYSVDFNDAKKLQKFLKDVDAIPQVDVLINNAGIHVPEPVSEIKDDNWERILQVNLSAPMALTRQVAGKMKKARQGKILNISSIAGIISKPGSGGYSASKAGLIGLTRAAALDLAPYSITVNCLCPGHSQTGMIDRVLTDRQKKEFEGNIPLGRFADPREIAQFAVFLCSEWNTYMTGQTIVVDGGVTAK